MTVLRNKQDKGPMESVADSSIQAALTIIAHVTVRQNSGGIAV